MNSCDVRLGVCFILVGGGPGCTVRVENDMVGLKKKIFYDKAPVVSGSGGKP